MRRKEYEEAKSQAIEYLKKANIVITDKEKNSIEVTDHGLNMLDKIGLQILLYINTERVCSKELVLFPRQICPEHRHSYINGDLGKEETFRCRWGKVYLYVPGESAKNAKAIISEDKRPYFTVWHEIELYPGEQYIISPNTLYWF